MDLQTQMKKIVADAAVREVEDGMILGLGSGSTAALMIKSLAEQIRSGKLKNIKGVPTSFQSEVLAPISVPVGNRSRIVTAMAMGALVIAHENTTLGNPELISGENCLLAKTASEFARNMQVAYMDPEYSKEIGSAARITYLESFEPQPAAKRLIDLLESIKVQ